VDKEGGGDNDSESEHIQSTWGDDDNNLGGDNHGDDEGEGLEELGTGDVDDEGRNGDEEEDYGYTYLVDKDSDEDSDDDEPLDIADDALGPEDGEGDVDEVNLLGFASF